MGRLRRKPTLPHAQFLSALAPLGLPRWHAASSSHVVSAETLDLNHEGRGGRCPSARQHLSGPLDDRRDQGIGYGASSGVVIAMALRSRQACSPAAGSRSTRCRAKSRWFSR